MREMKPGNAAEVTDAVLTAIAEKSPMELVGSATLNSIGRPSGTLSRLDLSGLAGLILYEPEELVLSALPGTTRGEIETLLSSHRQMLAFEPPNLTRLLASNAGGTLGGMVATNLSGPRRVKSGALRDYVLGFAGVSGRGKSFRCGGRVMKNVTGYDLPKLMTGSWGTLAALNEVTLKVSPAPEIGATLILIGLDEADAAAAMRTAVGSPLDVSGAAHLPADLASLSTLGEIASTRSSATLLRIEGFRASVAVRMAALKSLFKVEQMELDQPRSDTAWTEIRDVLPLTEPRDRIIWRVSVPPTAGPEAMANIRNAAPEALGFYDWAGGLLWVSVPHSAHGSAQAVRGAIAFTSGHATLIRGPEALRASVFVFHPLPDPLARLTERVKLAFDPSKILNPGRMYHFA